jgi:protein-tyrosine phosphatase
MSEVVPDETAYVLRDLHNLRDLGGLPTQDGHVVRRGVLIRSDSPHEASAADIDHLVTRLRVSTVIDLRSDKEFAADGTNALMPSSVRHQHFPISAGPGGAVDGAPAGDRLAARYMQYLDDDTASIVGAVRAVAEAPDGAAVVHCRVGKDRTGIVIALILDALGVSVADIAQDYHLTAEPMRKLLERLKASPVYAANVARLPDEMYSAEPKTMVSFLTQLHEEHGGAANWLLAHGLSPSQLDALHRHLIEGGTAPTSEGTST